MRMPAIRVSLLMAPIVFLFSYLSFSPGIPAVSANGTWQWRAPMPTARMGSASAVIDGKLYVVSGCCVDPLSAVPTRFTALEVYDPVANTWTSRSPIPTGVYGATTGVIGGMLYVAGGHARSENIPTLQIYNPFSNDWITGTPMPQGGGGAAGGAIGGKLYLAGGMNPTNHFDITTLRVFDPAANAWTTGAPMPTARTGAGGAILDGKLYVVGGLSGSPGVPRNELEVYDSVTNSWSARRAMPTARYGVGFAALDGILYAVGGYNNVNRLDVVEAYDPATDTWTTLGPMPEAHYWPAVGVIGQNMFVVGGEGVTGAQSVSNHVFSAPIVQATPAINVTGGTFTYDGNSHPATVSVTGTGGVTVAGFTSVTYSPGNFAVPQNAGTYAVNVAFTSSDPNYKNTSVSVPNAIVINRATPTVHVTGGGTFTYNAFSRSANASATGVGGEQVFGTFSLTYTPGGSEAPRTVGTYEALGTLTTNSFSNYTNATGTATITIEPSTANISGPSSVTAEATSHSGASAHFSLTAFDFDGSLTPTCSHVSGSTFPLGTTQVTCSASGANSVPGTKTFPVNVVDRRQPIIGPTSNISVTATSAQGALVTFPLPTVTDIADPNPAVTLSHQSGSLFPHGSTTVTITARDASGNTATRNFTVTVNAALVSIAVAPSTVTMTPGQGRQFTAMGVFTDKTTKTLPSTSSPGIPNHGPGNERWQVRFSPGLRVDPCTTTPVFGGLASQGFTPDAAGAVDKLWGQNNIVRATGTATDMVVSLSVACASPGLAAPVSLTATWTGTRFEGTMTDFLGNPVQVRITGWSSKAPMPSPRFALGAATLNVNGQDVVYAVGGASNTLLLGTLESYRPATNTWAVEPSMPTPREGAGVAAHNGHLFVVGGNVAGGSPSGVVETFDPVARTWNTNWPAMPTPRSHFSLVAAAGGLYAIGGDSPSGVVGTVERLDPAGWTTLAPLPLARRFTAAGALNNGQLIVVAGGSQANGPALDRVDLYNVAANSWTQGPRMLAPAAGAVGVAAMNALFVFGGTNNGALKLAEMYRPANGPAQPDGWAAMRHMPTARSQAGASLVGDVIYVMGGQAGSTIPQPGMVTLEAFSLQSPDQFSLSQGSGGGGSSLPSATWRLEPASGIASISSSGFVSTFAPGQATVIAEAAGLSCVTTNTCATLTVADTIPPVIWSVTPSLERIFPPNHKMVPVTIAVVVTDNVDPSPVCAVTAVRSSEPSGAVPDWDFDPGTLTVRLRASRAGQGDGRVYTIRVTCTDRSGNSSSESTTVLVPHDNRGSK